jgi:hypothetical protein
VQKDGLTSLVNSLILRDFKLPIDLKDRNPLLFDILNAAFEQRRDNRQLLLPNFEKTNTVAILSDYGGEAPKVSILHIPLHLQTMIILVWYIQRRDLKDPQYVRTK